MIMAFSVIIAWKMRYLQELKQTNKQQTKHYFMAVYVVLHGSYHRRRQPVVDFRRKIIRA
jgi:hypothetical protein